MIYQKSRDNKFRYLLGEEGSKKLIVLCLNPSKATDKIPDTTKTKIKNFSVKKGFDGWLILNLYPQRTTNPNGLHKEVNKEIFNKNLDYIESAVGSVKNPVVCAAWGEKIEKRGYLFSCLNTIYKRLKKFNPKWISIGELTKSDHPRHPSRLAYGSKIKEFDIQKYFKLMNINEV